MSPKPRLTDQLDYLDRVSQALAEPRRPLTFEEGAQLVATQGMVAPPEVLQQACRPAAPLQQPLASEPTELTFDSDRPRTRAEWETEYLTAEREVEHWAKKLKKWTKFNYLNQAMFWLLVMVCVVVFVWEKKHGVAVLSSPPSILLKLMNWGLLSGCVGSLIPMIGLALGAETCKDCHKDARKRWRALKPCAPSREQLQKWTDRPQLMAYLRRCMSSGVGVLDGDLDKLDRVYEAEVWSSRQPVSEAVLLAALNGETLPPPHIEQEEGLVHVG